MQNGKVQSLFSAAIVGRSKNYMRQMVLATAVAVALIGSTTIARAECGPSAGIKAATSHLPILATAGLMPEDDDHEVHKTIVGLWRTFYTSNGSPFFDTLKQWHSDGTEFENVKHNPAIGSVCVGVWKQVSPKSVRLHHLGFLFTTEGAPNGTFTVDEEDTLSANGMTYEGSFVFRIYDVNGTFTGNKFIGTVTATRITVS